MDFGSVPDWLSFGANAVMAIAAVSALTTWRREIVGRRRFEAAEDLLLRVYGIGYKLRSLRPLVSKPEGPLSAEQVRHFTNLASDTSRRLTDLGPDVAGLQGALDKAKAHLDSEIVRPLMDLIVEIQVMTEVALRHGELIVEGYPIGDEVGMFMAFDTDHIGDKIRSLVASIETGAKTHIR